MSNLAEMLRVYCRLNNIGVRELASKWESSPSTVSRLLNGKPIEMQTFVRVINWLLEEKK